MPKWFIPAAALCGLMFAASPFVIASADYESTMGLVQKIFYYHMPSAWMFLVAAIVCGVASVRFLATGDIRHDRTALAAGELLVMLILAILGGVIGFFVYRDRASSSSSYGIPAPQQPYAYPVPAAPQPLPSIPMQPAPSPP